MLSRPRSVTLIRSVFVLVTAALALWLVGQVTVAGVFRSSAPQTVLTFAPYDAGAKALHAQQMMIRSRKPKDLAGARRQAGEALRRDPTSVSAVTTIGLIKSAKNMADGDEAFRYAEMLSRRNQLSQMWLLERKVAANDIPGALQHYNAILSTSHSLRPQLYSVLIQASSERSIAVALNRLLRARPNWGEEFLGQLIARSSNAPSVLIVTNGLLRAGVEADRHLIQDLIKRLVTLEEFDTALRVYRDVRGTEADRLLRDASFQEADGLEPFDWSFPDDPAMVPERGLLEEAGGRNVLFLPSTSKETAVATQLLKLPTGSFALRARVGNVSGPEVDRPRFVVSCARRPHKELSRAVLPEAGKAGALVAQKFRISDQCNFVWLSIVVPGSVDAPSEERPWVAGVQLNPI